MKVKTKDKIVQRVLKKMDERSLIGQAKYGSTMHDEVSTNKKDLRDFLIDVQEELMDALLYLESARACLQEEIEDSAIAFFNEEASDKRMKQIGQNGNTGDHYDDFENDSSCGRTNISTYPESNIEVTYEIVKP